MAPLAATAQDPNPTPPPAAAEQKPDLGKVRGMVRQMVELKRAGKHDEAAQMAERIKAETHNNPRVIAMLERHKDGAAPVGRANRPDKSVERPNVKRGEESKNLNNVAMAPKVRLHHLRKAAEHLDAAGREGMAKAIRGQIAGIEKRMKNAQAPNVKDQAEPRRNRAEAKNRPMRPGQQPNLAPGQSGPRWGGPMPQGRGFGTPGQPAKPQARPQASAADPNAALVSEIRKLRQEMGELRGQVRRMHSNAAPAPKRPQAPTPPPVDGAP